MPKKRNNLVPVVCSKCKVKLCETLPGQKADLKMRYVECQPKI